MLRTLILDIYIMLEEAVAGRAKYRQKYNGTSMGKCV